MDRPSDRPKKSKWYSLKTRFCVYSKDELIYVQYFGKSYATVLCLEHENLAIVTTEVSWSQRDKEAMVLCSPYSAGQIHKRLEHLVERQLFNWERFNEGVVWFLPRLRELVNFKPDSIYATVETLGDFVLIIVQVAREIS